MLLQYVGYEDAAKAIEKAVDSALEKNITTSDINSKNPVSMSDVGDYVAKYILETTSVLA